MFKPTPEMYSFGGFYITRLYGLSGVSAMLKAGARKWAAAAGADRGSAPFGLF